MLASFKGEFLKIAFTLSSINSPQRSRLEYAEGVRELSPGWRLGGTLGIGSKKRVALKERKNRSETLFRSGSIARIPVLFHSWPEQEIDNIADVLFVG